jgi:16S rRNA processing protein RimM
MIVLGRIGEPYGIKGWIRIQPFGDDPLAWRKMSWWHLAANEQAPWQAFRLTDYKAHGKYLIAQFAEIGSRAAAEKLAGHLIGAPREDLPPTAENEFYWADLIGMQVETFSSQPLGKVTGLLETGAHTVLRVQAHTDDNDEARERLLPFVATVVAEVDQQTRKIQVDWDPAWD